MAPLPAIRAYAAVGVAGTMTTDSERELPRDVDSSARLPGGARREASVFALEGRTGDEASALYCAAHTLALRLTGARDRADDLTQEAFALLQSRPTYVPARGAPVVAHVLAVVKMLHRRECRRRVTERVRAARESHVDAIAVAHPSAEAVAIEEHDSQRRQQQAARMIEDLRRLLASRSTTVARIAVARLELVRQGIRAPAEQAARLNVSVEQIYLASEATQRQLRRLGFPPGDEEA